MRAVRAVLGPIILLWDKIFQPTALARDDTSQADVDAAAESLKLYELLACPFCVRVRRQMTRLAVPIETRNVKHHPAWRDELLREGGSPKVPCLRIEEDGGVRWLYESSAIGEYLETRFSA